MVYKIQGTEIKPIGKKQVNQDWTKKQDLERKKESNKDQLIKMRKTD